jgi:hypothetical protein
VIEYYHAEVIGTSFHLTHSLTWRRTKGYIEIIENTERAMLSSHSAKRFFKPSSPARLWQFRKILEDLFIWRLEIKKPNIVTQGNVRRSIMMDI